MTNICIIATIIIYLVAMLLVGFAYSKSNNDSTDFYLGGRKMGPLVTAMSAEASDMSSWLLMGMRRAGRPSALRWVPGSTGSSWPGGSAAIRPTSTPSRYRSSCRFASMTSATC